MMKSILYLERRGEWKKAHKDRPVAVFGWQMGEKWAKAAWIIGLTQSGLSRQGCWVRAFCTRKYLWPCGVWYPGWWWYWASVCSFVQPKFCRQDWVQTRQVQQSSVIKGERWKWWLCALVIEVGKGLSFYLVWAWTSGIVAPNLGCGNQL